MNQKIIPCIRCNDSNAKEIIAFYKTIFPDLQLIDQNEIEVQMSIFGYQIGFINGGEHQALNPSISFSLRLKDIDITQKIWDKLSEDGEVLMEYKEYVWSPAYGWCNDKFGVSRQIMFDNREDTHENAVIPSLMYTQDLAGSAESAINFYTSNFPDSNIDFLRRYEAGGVDKEGTINHGEFKLAHQQFIAMDSALDHKFSFNDGVSLIVMCSDQSEIDYYWDLMLSAGGQEMQCGWIQDQYGVRRQIVPWEWYDLYTGGDDDQSKYAFEKLMQMKKIILADLYLPSSK